MPTSLEIPDDSQKEALVAWVNTFPAVFSKISTVEELIDGLVLSDMLEDFDPEYAVKDLPTEDSTNWQASKQTLEAIYKSLIKYVHDRCDPWGNAAIDEFPIDFLALAQHSDPTESIKLLTLFLLVALKGPNQARYVDRVNKKLPLKMQSVIAKYLEKIETDLQTAVPDVNPNMTVSREAMSLEAKYSLVLHEHMLLKKRNADLITRLENLSESRDHLLDENGDQKGLIEQLQKTINQGDKADYIFRVESQLEEAEKLIASQEQELEEARVDRERMKKELGSMKHNRELEIRNKCKELEVENSALLKRANKVDHYEKKLAQQNTIERENARLREQLDVLQGNQKDYDSVYMENEILKTTRSEYMKVLEGQENTITDLKNKAMRLEEELRLRSDEIELALERQRHDEKYINELQERLNSSAEEPSGGGFSLEDELNRSDSPLEPHPQLEISRLRAELQVLKSNDGGKANAELRSELEKSEKQVRRLREKTQELKEAHAVTQDQISTIMCDRSLLQTDEADRSKSSERLLYNEATREIESLNRDINELSAKLTGSERDLLRARADLSAMDSDEITALEQLKEANKLIASSYEKDLTLLQAQHKNLRTEFVDQQSHLSAALISKEKLSQQLKTIFQRTPSSSEETGKNPEPATALDALKEQLQKKESIIQDLQRRLSLAEDPEAQKAANDVLLKNLTRENTLIATAWYDLTSRLQSNHVVLQRRQDAPKSWLNKQRQLLNSGLRR